VNQKFTCGEFYFYEILKEGKNANCGVISTCNQTLCKESVWLIYNHTDQWISIKEMKFLIKSKFDQERQDFWMNYAQ